MKNRLASILSTMIGNSPAILRYKNDNQVESTLVDLTDHRLHTVICCLKEGEILPSRNKQVTLIIKNDEHYFHCKGEVLKSFLNGRIFTLELIDASLFVKKNDEEVEWLEQLYKFEPISA